MNVAEIVQELDVFASRPPALTLSELSDFTDSNTDHETLQHVLCNDTRFICLSAEMPDEDRFILDSKLFGWLIRLNIRLAEISQFRLTKNQLATIMSHLRCDGRWSSPPDGAIRWGLSLGLVSSCLASDQYVFPLSWLLSFMQPQYVDVAKDILRNFEEEQIWRKPLNKLIADSLEECFTRFDKKIAHVVKAREGLLTGKKISLQQLGISLSLSRERIRQLEKIFWKKLKTHSKLYMRPFLVVFLYDFINESGSLIIKAGSPKPSLRSFLAKCLDIPVVKLAQIGVSVLATKQKNFTIFKSYKSFLDNIDIDVTVNRLESQDLVSLISSDVRFLSESMVNFFKEHLTKEQKVFLALRNIGQPAHFSEVAKVYNSLFSDDQSSERNIHAVLTRERYGIVWVRVAGTYALKEWGYTRPSKTLFDSVTEIVKINYKRTRQPVPYNVIMAEIGKYRKVVNPSSLFIASHLNPKLKLSSNDSFVPSDQTNEIMDDNNSTDQLDKILRRFQIKGDT